MTTPDVIVDGRRVFLNVMLCVVFEDGVAETVETLDGVTIGTAFDHRVPRAWREAIEKAEREREPARGEPNAQSRHPDDSWVGKFNESQR